MENNSESSEVNMMNLPKRVKKVMVAKRSGRPDTVVEIAPLTTDMPTWPRLCDARSLRGRSLEASRYPTARCRE